MIYSRFTIENFKGIDDVSINLDKNDLVLLLGLNESGKTTILKAIESFDFINDPTGINAGTFFRGIRKKADVNSNESAKITATIKLDNKIELSSLKTLLKTHKIPEDGKVSIESFFVELNRDKKVIISRVFPFKDGNPLQYHYEFVSEHPFAKSRLSRIVAQEVVRACPYIIYFEDFKDRIPEKIFITPANDAFNEDWYDIIDGLFYNTNKDFSIESYNKYFSKSNKRSKDANTVLKRVNKTLNKSFSDKWKELSGVQDIEETELTFNETRKYFEISITDTDGTQYTVDERSKGALWYLSFLMKTEFRRKKLRKNSGKPIFLIDEPASNLHSTAQQNMIEDFQKLVEDTTVIYSTHSQYLISTNNIKNTYVIKRDEGRVSAIVWSDYIKQDKSNETYYQPLANLLNIIPNNFSIPWNKAIITEGPSDMHVLTVMYLLISANKTLDFVIYPGTSAKNLQSLIALNIGWGANFKVLLDSDREGLEAQKKYIDDFDLNSKTIQVLNLPNKKIEGYFTEDDKINLYRLVFKEPKSDKINKKEFASIFALLSSSKSYKNKLKALLDPNTVSSFKSLFKALDL